MIEIDGIVYAENPRPELIRVLHVKPLDNYKLFLTFTNGKQKTYDMSKQLEQGIFKQLQDVNLFNRAYIMHGTVVWNDDLDICPDELYYNSIPISIPDIATPDEVEAIRIGREEFKRGETIKHDDIDWS